jgi:hypothetical protein
MDYQLIATWLGLPAGSWPPDHYTLLGLPAGETNEARIEQQVHERLARVRCYQLCNPELATEAMKRIAQASDCLSNPKAKKAYDSAHFPQIAARLAMSSARAPTVLNHDTGQNTPVHGVPMPTAGPAAHDAAAWWAQQEMVWKPQVAPPPVRAQVDTEVSPPPVRIAQEKAVTPPPVRLAPEMPTPPPVREPVADAEPPPLPQPAAEPPVRAAPPATLPVPVAPPQTTAPRAKPVDPIFELAKSSPAIKQGLGTRKGLYERAVWLRQILTAWERAGKHISRPKKRLTRTAEETDLARQLEAIEELLHEQPSLLGQPGQPGYRVMALGHDDPIAGFKSLDEQERDLLARDWIAGRTLLRTHRKFLCEQVRKLRRLTPGQRLVRTIDATLTDYRGWVLLALVLVMVAVLAGVFFL